MFPHQEFTEKSTTFGPASHLNKSLHAESNVDKQGILDILDMKYSRKILGSRAILYKIFQRKPTTIVHRTDIEILNLHNCGASLYGAFLRGSTKNAFKSCV
jgi:hypothetical protein